MLNDDRTNVVRLIGSKVMLKNLSERSLLMLSLLESVLDYDKLTGIFRWKAHLNRNTKVGEIAGSVNTSGYVLIRINRCQFYAHNLAWFLVYGEYPKQFIDHKNGICSDNRIVNLRLASDSQNGANSKTRSDNTSGYRGVTRIGKGWAARICVNNRTKHLGMYDDKISAARAYNRAALKYFGEFARLNEVPSIFE